MPTYAGPLGKEIDVCHGISPLDLQTARTGARLHLKNYTGALIVFYAGAGTAGDDPVLDLQEHTAASGGTSQDLDIVTAYWHKSETTLDGDEAWTKVTQSAASELSDPGGAGTSAEVEKLVCYAVYADQLSDGYEWISVNVADTGTNAQLGCVLYIPFGLKTQRTPANLAQPNA